MKQLLTSAACAAALGVFGFSTANAAAPAPVPQATVAFNYSYVDLGSGIGHVNDLGGAVAGVLPLGTSHFSMQIDGAYNNLSQSGFSISDWSVDGALSWRGSRGRVGANVGYDTASVPGFGNFSTTTYGAYGEWYAADRITVGVKGGGVTLNAFGGSATGGYAGGQLVGYAMPDLALSAKVDYSGFSNGHIVSGGVKAEYLVSQSFPVSVFAGYTYSELNSFGSVRSNTFSVGAKYHFGAKGASLLDRQRDGVDDWGPNSSAQSILFVF